MSGSFQLTLDTTSPYVEIIAPHYTTGDTNTEILVQASEKLDPYQEFYFIDSLGKRHDVIFLHQGNSFLGDMRFSEFPPGVTTLYAMVKDSVLNRSPIVSHSINIQRRAYVDLEVMEQSMRVDSSLSNSKVICDDMSWDIRSEEGIITVDLIELARRIEVDIKDG